MNTHSAILATYGRAPETFSGSPFEGTELEEVEVALHEMAHSAQLGLPLGSAFHKIEARLDDEPAWRQDLHEIRSGAIELLAAAQFGIGNLTLPKIDYLIAKNLRNRPASRRVRVAIKRAMRTRKCRSHADRIVASVKHLMESLGTWSRDGERLQAELTESGKVRMTVGGNELMLAPGLWLDSIREMLDSGWGKG